MCLKPNSLRGPAMAFSAARSAVFQILFLAFLYFVLSSMRKFWITLDSWPLLEGDFGLNLFKKGTLIFFTKNDLSPLGFLKPF